MLLKFLVIELRAKLGEGHVGGARCVLVRDFLLPVWPIGGESDTKFSLLVQNASKMGISGVLGEFCTGWARRGCEPGEFCTDTGPACGTKFSLLGENRSKRAVSGVLGEFCTGWARRGCEPGEFCTGWARRTGYARRVLYRFSAPGLRAGRVLYRAPPRPRPPPPDEPVGIRLGDPRGPGAWRARRRLASRCSGTPAPPTRRPSRSSGMRARSRGR